jgi:molybdate transport system substrate-binding protein
VFWRSIPRPGWNPLSSALRCARYAVHTLTAALACRTPCLYLPTHSKRIEAHPTMLIWVLKNQWRRRAAVLAGALSWTPVGAWTPTAATTLTVSIAASLQDAMRDIGRAFEAQRPTTRVQFNVASSGALLAQIAQGAPVDVLAAADTDTMDRAQAQRLIVAATRTTLAANTLVLVSPLVAARGAKGAPPRLNAIDDLLGSGVQRLAIGTPSTVPAGRYAQAAFEASGVWAALRPKLVFADNVRQVLTYVARGEADAGVVYRTDALIAKDTVRIDLALLRTTAVTYPIAVVAATANAAAAADFVRFATEPPAQAVLARYGFAPAVQPLPSAPPAPAPAPSPSPSPTPTPTPTPTAARTPALAPALAPPPRRVP